MYSPKDAPGVLNGAQKSLLVGGAQELNSTEPKSQAWSESEMSALWPVGRW
jgi:hypothetical protein